MNHAQGRLDSARQRLEAARLLHRHGFAADAMNRLYFSVLESARALLLLRNLAPKTHRGVGMGLAEHFREDVNIGLLSKLRQHREEADYHLRVPPPEIVERCIKDADQFVESTARHVEGQTE